MHVRGEIEVVVRGERLLRRMVVQHGDRQMPIPAERLQLGEQQ
jgi:hypothetical protein